MGMVHRSEVELAVGGIALAEKRLQDVNFSYLYQISDCTFLTDKPKPTSMTLTLIYAFSEILWILIILVVLLLPFLLFLLVHRKKPASTTIIYAIQKFIRGNCHHSIAKIKS